MATKRNTEEKLNNDKYLSEQHKEHFQLLFDQIYMFIDDDRLEDALELVNNELDEPYLTPDVSLDLLNLKKNLEQDIKHIKYENEIETMSKLEMWNRVYNADKSEFDVVFFNIIVDKYIELFEEVDYLIIKKILLDKNVSNDKKLLIITTFADYELNFDFEIYNKKLNKKFKSSILKVVKQFKFLEKTMNLIEKQFHKDPSKNEFAANLLQLLFSHYIPEKIPFSEQEIATTIINMVNNLFGLEKLKSNEITKILKSYTK